MVLLALFLIILALLLGWSVNWLFLFLLVIALVLLLGGYGRGGYW